MTRAIDRILILSLTIALLLALYRLSKEQPLRNESFGGASPEFVNRIEAQTEDAKKRLQQKQQADLAANRLGS